MFFLLAKRRHFSQVDGASALVAERVNQGSYGLCQGPDDVLQTSEREMKVAKPS